MSAPLLPSLGLISDLLLPLHLGACQWAEENVDMTVDVTAPTPGLIRLEPYQRDPIAAQFEDGTSEVIVMAPPQTGKSICWRIPIFYRLAQPNTGPGWILYESDEKGKDINREQVRPFVEAIPGIRNKLRPEAYAATNSGYLLTDGILEFSGAGTPPTSKPEKFAVADELPTWPGTAETQLKTMSNLRDRLRRFNRDPHSCLTIVGSPQGETDPVADLFDDSTREHWHLRCEGCGRLSIPSHGIKHLQFKVDDHGQPIEKSISLDCPDCGREHREAEAQRMNDRGAFVAAGSHPFRRGFHWGALASPTAFRWLEIAMMQLAAGQTGTLADQLHFAKSVLGMRYRRRSTSGDRDTSIRSRYAPAPSRDRLAILLFSADTQDTGFYWIVRAVLTNRESHLVAEGFAGTFDELSAAWDAEYLGARCAVGIIDEGGHRGKDVQAWVTANAGTYTYKGTTQIGGRYKLADFEGGAKGRRLRANPYTYQAALLHALYAMELRKDAEGRPLPTPGYLWLSPSPSDEYIEHISAYAPNRKVKNGNRYEHWTADDRPDHFFDCEKQAQLLLEYVEDQTKAGAFPDVWIHHPEWIATPPPPRRRRAPQIPYGV